VLDVPAGYVNAAIAVGFGLMTIHAVQFLYRRIQACSSAPAGKREGSKMIIFPIVVVMILYFSSIPIAFALLAATMAYFTFGNVGSPPDLILQRFITSASSFPLLAVPFFIMVGEVMNFSGISSSLMKFADVLTGHMKGGLAQVNVVLSTLMGGISGSANADAAMQSKILVPEMEKRGYGRAFSAAITAASSAIAPVIPPGINLIIYALIAQVSVAKMFIGGYVPGLLMCFALMIAVRIIAGRRKYLPMRTRCHRLRRYSSRPRVHLGPAPTLRHHLRHTLRRLHAHRGGRRGGPLLHPRRRFRL
jgi:TRAP-type mannitol/chloroaromatic compound transport system permease large subunit